MSVILAAVLPVLITTLIGYGLAKTAKPFDPKTVTFLVGAIGTPVLVFNSLAHTQVSAETLATMAGATIAAMACFLGLSAVLLKLFGLPLRTFLPSLSFPNTGNLGLPLSLYAFGQAGLDYAVVMFALVAIGNHTVGRTIMSGSANLKPAVQNPVMPAMVLGVAVSVVDIPLPQWLSNTVEIMSGLTIPLMLLMLGTSLAKIPVTTFPRSLLLAVLRIGTGMAVGFALAGLFGFEGAARGAFVIQCSMPVAVYNYVYAQMYEHGAEDVASLVFVSTVLSVVTTPLLLALLVR